MCIIKSTRVLQCGRSKWDAKTEVWLLFQSQMDAATHGGRGGQGRFKTEARRLSLRDIATTFASPFNAFSEENFIGYIVTYLIATALTQRTYYTYQMLSILLQFEKTFANVAGYISPFPFPLPSFGGLFVEFVPLPHSIRAETEMFRQFFSQIQ